MNIWLLVGIFVILDLSLLTFVIVSRSRKSFSEADKKKYREHWQRIAALDGRQAVVEADMMLDELLGKKGYSGTMGEKLKKAGPAFTNVNDVWSAHKLRNRLVHELNMKVSAGEAKTALNHFARAFKDLGLHL